MSAFSLAELMVVIGIIGLLAALGLPALKGLGATNSIDAATRQMLDELAYARLRAMNDRTTVYMLFAPPRAELQSTNLAPFRYTGYTLFSRRSLGDQPGRSTSRQLTQWRTLPDKTFFAVPKFFESGTTNIYEQAFAWTNNFALTIANRPRSGLQMNYLAFNPQGQVVRFDGNGNQIVGRDEYVALVRGSIMHPVDASGMYSGAPDVVDTPRGNRRYIRINWLTGRAQVVGDATLTGGVSEFLGEGGLPK